ncbi:hypothetical protein COCNU_10G001180 [Cocos nucifera]|uniref:Uncharacterized protein n=1 Tax=Cocos nucifera TaxID=13894 RepID=A0A8K0N8G0_COCNU|nr:hypothetical protein COCNU_10G001180 [Cocos nucifera]
MHCIVYADISFISTMPKLQGQSFMVQASHKGRNTRAGVVPKLNMWPTKLFGRFCKILVGFFSLPSKPPTITHQRFDDEHPDIPKRSSSSLNLYPLTSHYEEAITDCIEFFNKSSKSTGLSGRNFEEFV